jgi:hypothetical protein
MVHQKQILFSDEVLRFIFSTPTRKERNNSNPAKRRQVEEGTGMGNAREREVKCEERPLKWIYQDKVRGKWKGSSQG